MNPTSPPSVLSTSTLSRIRSAVTVARYDIEMQTMPRVMTPSLSYPAIIARPPSIG
jgi:hypothetical protein